MLGNPHYKSFPPQTDWSDSTGVTTVSDPLLSHHEIEQLIWRELHSLPGVHFFSLTVRRVRNGVCLQGVMEADDTAEPLELCELVRQIAQIETVVNQLLVREPDCLGRRPR